MSWGIPAEGKEMQIRKQQPRARYKWATSAAVAPYALMLRKLFPNFVVNSFSERRVNCCERCYADSTILSEVHICPVIWWMKESFPTWDPQHTAVPAAAGIQSVQACSTHCRNPWRPLGTPVSFGHRGFRSAWTILDSN